MPDASRDESPWLLLIYMPAAAAIVAWLVWLNLRAIDESVDRTGRNGTPVGSKADAPIERDARE